MNRISTEYRLALAFALVLAIILAATFVTLHTILASDATRELDLSLKSAADDAASRIDPAAGGLGHANMLLDIHSTAGLAAAPPLVVVRRPDGSVLSSTLPLDDAGRLLPPTVLESARAGNPGFHSLEASPGNTLRIYTRPVRDNDGKLVAIVQAAGRLDPLAESSGRLGALLVLEGAIGLVLGAAVAAALTKATMRPLSNVVQFLRARDRIGPGDRLQPEGPPDVRLLANSLNEMLERFEHELDDRQQFVMTVSHELRTPLTALRGTIDVLLLAHSLDPPARQQLQSMSQECARLLRLSQNLLLLGRAELGFGIERVPVQLEDIVVDVAREARALSPGNDLRVEVRGQAFALADPDRLRQALLNLLDNAFRHGGDRVTLRFAVVRHEAVFEVRDNGPGLRPEDAARLGDPTRRTPGRHGGSGLGLGVVRWVAAAHGGLLEAPAVRGRHNRLRVRIPLVPAEAGGHIALPDLSATLAGQPAAEPALVMAPKGASNRVPTSPA
ncbi:MAG: sensor histidine kinase [Hyphomicrobiales bacterium]